MRFKLFILAFFAVAFIACRDGYFQKIPTKVRNFNGVLVTGDSSSYIMQKGRVTFIVLTASWCPSCRQELPMIKELDNEFNDKGLQIILISEDNTRQEAFASNRANNITWPTFMWNYEILNTLGNPGAVPISYLVNAKDSILKINVGAFDEIEIRRLIRKSLKK